MLISRPFLGHLLVYKTTKNLCNAISESVVVNNTHRQKSAYDFLDLSTVIKMVSDFRKKKLLHVFQAFFDLDKSGSIDKKDFEESAERIAKLRGWSAGDAKFQEVKNSLAAIWQKIQKHGDVDGDGKVTSEEWISMCDDYVKSPSTVEWQNLYMKFIFSLEDASNDGSIDEDEFSSVYVSFGLNKDECKTAFKKMAKGKTNVSWGEFQQLWKEYFVSEDPNAPGNFIFGKTSY